MTKVNFYRINGNLQAALILACQLTEKAWQQGMTVLIHADQSANKQLDELLWSFSKTAFLPHAESECPREAISITSKDNPGDHHGLLISLTEQTPSWFSRFEKVAEIIYDEPALMAHKRESFRLYKSRGYPLQYHELASS